MADFDGDGALDAVLWGDDGGAQRPIPKSAILLGSSNGHFGAGPIVRGHFLPVDLNRDGRPDLAGVSDDPDFSSASFASWDNQATP